MRRSKYKHDELKWKVQDWAAQLGVKVKKVNVRKMKRKWASVSTAGYLTLNSDLTSVSKDLCDYVILHEITHLLAPNHSKLFKSYLHTYMPDWETRQEKLRKLDREKSEPASVIE